MTTSCKQACPRNEYVFVSGTGLGIYLGNLRFVTLISLAPNSVNKATERKGIIMNDLITDRTSLVIAAEINTIRHQTGKIILAGAIEIGRRLKEAKDLLLYEEWGKWLNVKPHVLLKGRGASLCPAERKE